MTIFQAAPVHDLAAQVQDLIAQQAEPLVLNMEFFAYHIGIDLQPGIVDLDGYGLGEGISPIQIDLAQSEIIEPGLEVEHLEFIIRGF